MLGIAAPGGRGVYWRETRAQMKFFASLSPCLVGMEACSTAHHWARELKALGHEIRLMPPTYVKPYVKRGTTRHPACPLPFRIGNFQSTEC
jgi:transposase